MSIIEPPDEAELQRLVDEAKATSAITVRIVFTRKTPPKAVNGSVRLYGRSGPWSSEDKRVEQIDATTIAAIFRVCDLACYLRARHDRCYAIGCHEQRKRDHLMCTRHWSMVPARIQVDAYRAKGRVSLANVSTGRAWLVAAQRSIGWVAVAEGKATEEEVEERIAAYKAFPGLAPDAAPVLDPYAFLEAASHA